MEERWVLMAAEPKVAPMVVMHPTGLVTELAVALALLPRAVPVSQVLTSVVVVAVVAVVPQSAVLPLGVLVALGKIGTRRMAREVAAVEVVAAVQDPQQAQQAAMVVSTVQQEVVVVLAQQVVQAAMVHKALSLSPICHEQETSSCMFSCMYALACSFFESICHICEWQHHHCISHLRHHLDCPSWLDI
jgi:hypothetical protein